MSDSDWRPILALGIIATLLFMPAQCQRFESYQTSHREERVEASQNDAGARSQQGEASCTRVASNGSFTCTFNIVEADAADPYAEHDLRAQQDMAEWALGVLIATVIGLIVTTVGLLYIARAYTLNAEQVELARKANEQAQRAFEESERPLFFMSIVDWQDPVPGESPTFDFDEELREIAQRIRFQNVGTRPAFGVSLRTAIGFLGTGDQTYEFITDGLEDFAPGQIKTHFILHPYVPDRPPILERIAAGEVLHITGIYIYEDALGVRRERGFRFFGRVPEGLFGRVLQTVVWDRVNDPRFTYDKRVEPDRV